MINLAIAGLNCAVFVHAVCRLAERKYFVTEVRLWALAAMAGSALGGMLFPGHPVPYIVLLASVVGVALAQWNPFGVTPRGDRRTLNRRAS